MGLPISGNQLKKLTRRLRDGAVEPADWEALAEVLLYYKDVLDEAHADVERLCATMPAALPMTPRVKTLKTTLEKLRRQQELHSLAQVRDIAGLRVVVQGSRKDQDDVVARIAELFPEPPPKIIDRRAEPKQGYRAVHLEVRQAGVLVEIQIRTELQHQWAELFERTADKLGRGLRYGESVRGVEEGTFAGTVVDYLLNMAKLIDASENYEVLSGQVWDEMRSRISEHFTALAGFVERLP